MQRTGKNKKALRSTLVQKVEVEEVPNTSSTYFRRKVRGKRASLLGNWANSVLTSSSPSTLPWPPSLRSVPYKDIGS